MSEIDHSERAHALLGPSASHTWLLCPPSARLGENIPERGEKTAAKKGTLCHEATDSSILHFLGELTTEQHAKNLAKIKADPLWEDSMVDRIEQAVVYGVTCITNAWAEFGRDQVLVLVEQRVHYDEWVPEGFGSADLVIVTPEYIMVIDWKYGRIQVDAKGNPQARLYGAAVATKWSAVYGFTRVISTIVQPYLDHVDSDEIALDELMRWMDEYVRPRAALAWEGKGEFVPGDKQCMWCRAKSVCRARADYNLAVAGDAFALPAALDDAELAALYLRIASLRSWCDDVEGEVTARMVQERREMPGLKVVEGKSNRQITDPVTARRKLLEAGYSEDDILEPPAERKLLGITALEKVVGKKAFNSVLADVVVKPSGKPTVVSVADPREAVQPPAASPEESF